MRLINKNRFLAQTILLIFGALIFNASCDNPSEEFEKKGPKRQESRRVIVDVNLVSDDDKTNFEAIFYYDIPGMIDGKEVSGLKKEIIKVRDAKLGDAELKESTDSQNRTTYITEITNEKKEYELTFSPNENLKAAHKIKIDPMFIEEENLRLEKSKTPELELSRKAISGELPAVVEIKNVRGDFLPAGVDYLSQKLFFRKKALTPFPNGKNTLRVRFETIPNQRDENKSIRFINYVINKSIEIID